jgi:hypothetical protein
MFKNIVLGVVLTSISAGLVYGAVTRTELRETTAVGGNGAGSGNYNVTNERGGRNQNESDFLNERNSGNGNRGGSGNGQGSASSANGEPQELSLAEVDEIVEFTGVVREVSADYMLMDVYDEGQILVENRAWWFAVDAGFSTAAGDEITVLGFYDDDGAFEAISIENLTQGTSVQIREDTGRPLWAGNGNSGNGNGNR